MKLSNERAWRLVAIFCCLSFFFFGLTIGCNSQTLKKFKSTSWGQTNWGYYYHPTAPGKYPAVIFFHGSGEVGTDSVAATSLLRYGPLTFVKTGWRPNLVIFAIQVSYWSPDPGLCKYILENDPDVTPYWDGTNVLWTGLSAGGERVLEALSLKYTGSFCPMSPAALDFSKIDLSVPYRVWDFHASNDNICPYQYSVDLVNLLNTTHPGTARLTTYSGGHGNWNTFYDPTYKDPLNIYDWSAAAATPPAKQVLVTITVYTDGSTDVKQNN
jgi:predicted peptidase